MCVHSSTLIVLCVFQVEGILAAIDTTKEKKLGDRFKIKGFPTGKPAAPSLKTTREKTE